MSYTHLTEKERYVISHLIAYGLSIREVARRLCRSHSTISRELKRNESPRFYRRLFCVSHAA